MAFMWSFYKITCYTISKPYKKITLWLISTHLSLRGKFSCINDKVIKQQKLCIIKINKL